MPRRSNRFMSLCCTMCCITLGSSAVLSHLCMAEEPAHENLSNLSDDALLEELYRSEAKEELLRRLRTYPEEQRRALTEKLEAHRPKRRFPEEFETPELLEHLDAYRDAIARVKAHDELRSRIAAASPVELARTVDAFRAHAHKIIRMPGRGPKEVGGAAYTTFVADAWTLFPEETALSLLWELYVDADVFGSVQKFVSAIQKPRYPPPGEATVAVLLQVHEGLPAYSSRQLWGDTPGIVRQQVYGALGRCGEPGAEALVRLGAATGSGLRALATSGASYAKDHILDYYYHGAETPDGKMNALNALHTIRARSGDPELGAFFRRELPKYLETPEDGYWVSILENAVHLIGRSKDPALRPHLTALQDTIARTGLVHAEEHAVDRPEQWEQRLAQLTQAIEKANASLDAAAAE